MLRHNEKHFRPKNARVQGDISTVETGTSSREIAIACCLADLIALNIDMSGLEFDVKSINETITRSKRNIETNAANMELSILILKVYVLKSGPLITALLVW
jgi:hypothetical protein